jgi:hypothetical protein
MERDDEDPTVALDAAKLMLGQAFLPAGRSQPTFLRQFAQPPLPAQTRSLPQAEAGETGASI